jgi:hypothetical protein
MAVFRKICVVSAFALLFLAGTDLFSDLVLGAFCDGSSSATDSGTSNDECFCCCGHYVVPAAPVLMRNETVTLYADQQPVLPNPIQLPSVYHPPKS